MFYPAKKGRYVKALVNRSYLFYGSRFTLRPVSPDRLERLITSSFGDSLLCAFPLFCSPRHPIMPCCRVVKERPAVVDWGQGVEKHSPENATEMRKTTTRSASGSHDPNADTCSVRMLVPALFMIKSIPTYTYCVYVTRVSYAHGIS